MAIAGGKQMTREDALAKAQRFCAYQERSVSDVRTKLRDLKVKEKDFDFILKKLEEQKFLDERRFAKVYTQGKFSLKKWGKIKIEWALREKSVPEKFIAEALQEIDEDDYYQTLESILSAKLKTLNDPDAYQKKDQAAKFAIGKGFEPDLVWDVLKSA